MEFGLQAAPLAFQSAIRNRQSAIGVQPSGLHSARGRLKPELRTLPIVRGHTPFLSGQGRPRRETMRSLATTYSQPPAPVSAPQRAWPRKLEHFRAEIWTGCSE